MPRPNLLSAFLRLPRPRRQLLPEALLTLAWTSLLVRCLPFRTVLRFADRSRLSAGPASTAIAADAVWAVEVCARRVPWRAVCFQQGLAVHLMLRRRGIASVLHYGVRQGAAEGLKAHVWVTLDDAAVIGGEQAPRFACLMSVPSPAART